MKPSHTASAHDAHMKGGMATGNQDGEMSY